MGREEFAVYSIGAHQLPFVMIIASSVASITFPLMAQYQKEGRFTDFVDLWKRAWLKTSVLFFPIFVFFMVTASQFIIIFFTDAYAGAIPVFRIYLFLFLKATTDFAGVLTAFKKQDYLFKITAISVVANLILSIVMFKLWGRLGVPLATVLTFLVVTILAIRKSSVLLEHPVWQMVPWRGLFARMSAASVPGAILYVIYARHPDYSIVGFALAGVSYFTAYFVLCWFLKLITLEDIKSLMGKPRRANKQAR